MIQLSTAISSEKPLRIHFLIHEFLYTYNSSLVICCVCHAKLLTGNIENFTCASAIVDKFVHHQGYEESPYVFAHLH